LNGTIPIRLSLLQILAVIEGPLDTHNSNWHIFCSSYHSFKFNNLLEGLTELTGNACLWLQFYYQGYIWMIKLEWSTEFPWTLCRSGHIILPENPFVQKAGRST
jgi:hypothetical protein